MKAGVTLIGLLVIVTTFKSTDGIQCHTCAYYITGGKEYGDSSCKYGGESLPAEECSENSIIRTSTVIPGGRVVRLGEVRDMMTDPAAAQSKTHYGCERNEVSATVNGGLFYMMSRSCTFNTARASFCKRGSKEDFMSMIHQAGTTQAAVKIDDFQLCNCFEDKCNSGSKPSGTWIITISVVGLTVVYYALMKM